MIGETAQIIQFSASRPKFGKQPLSQNPASNDEAKRDTPQCEENVSTTCKNQRIRQQRHARWREADVLREYFRASLEFGRAISGLQRHNLPEGDLHPQRDRDFDYAILAKYRAAIVQQLLTPASTVAEITWKRAAFKAGQHRHTDEKPERIERAIADDVEFLKAHPTRRPAQPQEGGAA
jgi:hypothetical protein